MSSNAMKARCLTQLQNGYLDPYPLLFDNLRTTAVLKSSSQRDLASE